MESSSGEKKIDHAIAGAVCGSVTRFICQPFDVVKIRFQLQVEPIKKIHESKYKSMVHAVNLIVKEEGITALWKGHASAQLLSITYGGAQFYWYYILKSYTDVILNMSEWRKTVNFMIGGAAGGIATIVSFPFDTVRTRLIAQSSNYLIYQGLIHAHINMFKSEGPKSFFRGLSPTLLQILPHTGFQFMFYNIFVDTYKYYSGEEKTELMNSIIAGSSAGLIAKTIVYPFDLARKRLQIQGFQRARKVFGKSFSCSGLVNCFVVTARTEGFRGLYKGLVPSQLKASATTGLHFMAYEQSLIFIQSIRKSENL